MKLLGFLLLALLFTHYSPTIAESETKVFVFGDSLADVGNNNYLQADNPANHPYYGIDYPGGNPTGRYSNGYNGADYVAMHMGLNESPPAVLSLKSDVSKQLNAMQSEGLNFASGGSGILDNTGNGKVITMAQQIQSFADLRSKLEKRIGPDRTNSLLSKSIFLISAGSNDIIAPFLPNKSHKTTEKEQFISQYYVDHVKELYNLGARKFALIDVPPIGCCPGARAMHNGSCNLELNILISVFNWAIKERMRNLPLEGMKYSIGSSYAVLSSIKDNPRAFGFTEVEKACCGNGMSECNQSANLCTDRDRYLFWDGIHPTQATAQVASLAFYNGSLEFASPINFKQLVKDDSYESGLLLQPTKQYA